MDVKNWIIGGRVAIGMLMVQVIAAGMQLLSRVILSQGMFVFALVLYRHIVGAIAVVPFALFRDRGREIRFSWSAFFWLFAVALTGITMATGFFYYGLRDTTATYATNFLNLIPIVTFLFSTILRIEKLRLHTKAGKIKVVGASLCLAGALTVALYKGKVIKFSSHRSVHHKVIADKMKPNWVRGTIFLICSCLSYGMWFIIQRWKWNITSAGEMYIVINAPSLMGDKPPYCQLANWKQAKLVNVFPHRYWATMLTCIVACVQNAVIGSCADTRKSSWHLGWNLQLVAIIYSGVLSTAATFCLISWAVAKRGPTYPSMFNPLSLIFVAISEALFLGEEIRAGSLIGMALIIVGLYSFLWGKKMELKSNCAPDKESVAEMASKVTPESSVVVPVPADPPTINAAPAQHASSSSSSS